MAAKKCEYKPIRKRRVISLKSLHFGPRNECKVQFWGHLSTNHLEEGPAGWDRSGNCFIGENEDIGSRKAIWWWVTWWLSSNICSVILETMLVLAPRIKMDGKVMGCTFQLSIKILSH